MALPLITAHFPLGTLPTSTTAAREYSAEEKMACSLDAMLNGGTCEACQ
jgi:ribonucleoside-diphosphate reductase alpha chain